MSEYKMINHNSKNRTSATADMSSKFKMKSFGGAVF